MILKTSFLTLILKCEENCFTVNAIDLKMHQLGLLLGHYSFYLKFLFFRRCFSSEIRSFCFVFFIFYWHFVCVQCSFVWFKNIFYCCIYIIQILLALYVIVNINYSVIFFFTIIRCTFISIFVGFNIRRPANKKIEINKKYIL